MLPPPPAFIKVLTTGGTIDKVYFDALSNFSVGDSLAGEVFRRGRVPFDFEVEQLMQKDSLELNDADRACIHRAVQNDSATHLLITHGTDTMAETARTLMDIKGKTVVLTGSMQPARFADSDAVFNLGCALGALQVLPPGIYLAMNGQIFDADQVQKNRDKGCFERISGSC